MKKSIFKSILLMGMFVLYAMGANAQLQEKQEEKLLPKPPHKASIIPVEMNFGNNRFGLQFLINTPMPEVKKLSFFTVTSFESGYRNTDGNLDYISNSQVSYQIYKGFAAAVGLSVNSKSGMSPTAGLKYVFANREILFVVTPTIHVSTNHNIEGLTLLEYKPAITKNLHLYTRFQGFYNRNLKYDHHERSYMQLRAGVGIKSYQFGLAANWDYYGPAKLLKDNYGIFLRVNL
jgi:hypothetical protein